MGDDDKRSIISAAQVVTPSSTAPPYTVADLSQNLASNSTQAIGGTTPEADAAILRDIIMTIKKKERWWFYFWLIILLPLFPITWIVLITCCDRYSRQASGMERIAKEGIRYMIRLEGNQWSRYVQHILADSPRKLKNVATKRLLDRGYGHVLLSPYGFFLDALIGMTYENIMIVRTEIIRAPNGVDTMLRAWFCKRVVVVRVHGNGPVHANNDPFKFDIFLPPQMPTEQLSAITNFMMVESTCNPL